MSVITIRRGRAMYGAMREPIESSGDDACASAARLGTASAVTDAMMASHRGTARGEIVMWRMSRAAGGSGSRRAPTGAGDRRAGGGELPDRPQDPARHEIEVDRIGHRPVVV